MEIIDANYILQYLLKDIENQFSQAKDIIESENVFVPDFIIAEVIYVLEKVYNIQRDEIRTVLENLLNYENIEVRKRDAVIKSLRKNNVDYADALLLAYFQTSTYNKLYTFDKKILKLISSD